MHEVRRLCDEIVIINLGEKCFSGTTEEMRMHGDSLGKAFLNLIGHVLGRSVKILIEIEGFDMNFLLSQHFDLRFHHLTCNECDTIIPGSLF